MSGSATDQRRVLRGGVLATPTATAALRTEPRVTRGGGPPSNTLLR